MYVYVYIYTYTYTYIYYHSAPPGPHGAVHPELGGPQVRCEKDFAGSGILSNTSKDDCCNLLVPKTAQRKKDPCGPRLARKRPRPTRAMIGRFGCSTRAAS